MLGESDYFDAHTIRICSQSAMHVFILIFFNSALIGAICGLLIELVAKWIRHIHYYNSLQCLTLAPTSKIY